MLEWVQTSTPSDTDPAGDKTDEILEEQPIKDPEKAQSLIAIENARSERDLRLAEPNWTNRLRILALAGAICLIALMILVAGAVAGAVFVVDKAARLKLSWPPAGTSTLTFACASLSGAAAWRVGQAVLRRRAARASAENPPESRTEDDQNPVGAP
ncbi:hypothetical protein OHA74_53205 [Streptomyces phaeochromogenes]|uniref:hypothetical protein n=1 Tax=Streptomyces phaeochromogenes TaxID=1923 RepID=UPI002E2B1EEE|nr:hypothetical protein [Streptomyces phaeochromogenes]